MNTAIVFRALAALSVLLLAGCGSGGSSDAPVVETAVSDQPATAQVFRSATFTVDIARDVVYAQGQSHTDWNAPNPITKDLLLDVYSPMNDEIDRPAMMFVHGGGFTGGSKDTMPPSDFARYFAERGFVAVAINYRLLGDYGTLPPSFVETIDAVPGLTDEDRDQSKAMYAATRDAKAALRWLSANAVEYGSDPNQISVAGGSAGSFIAIALGASDFDDYARELTLDEDPTLATTHLEEDVFVASVVNHWGGTATTDLLQRVDGSLRWDAADAPISIVHGTADLTVSYEQAEALVDIYTNTGAYFELNTLQGAGHAAWNATLNGQTLTEMGFDFITRMLDIEVQEN